jgi:hypothetical protein
MGTWMDQGPERHNVFVAAEDFGDVPLIVKTGMGSWELRY